MENKEKWIIDTDPGCDDLMAILYFLNNPKIEILMIATIDGNVCLENVTKNARKILKLTNKKIPIYKGSHLPILKTYNNVVSYHHFDGLGDIEEIINYDANEIPVEKENSSIKIVEYIMKYPNEVNLLLLGPLTNIANAFMLNPNISQLVKSVYMMGGSINSRGNLNSVGEFNFGYDFIATKIVLSNFKNIVITPWEPTEVLMMTNEEHEAITKKISIKNSMTLVHHFCTLIINRYTKEKKGIEFCDLYAAISCLNKRSVKKYFLCQFDIIMDSLSCYGMVYIKHKKFFSSDFWDFIDKEYPKYIGTDYHLVIEEFDSQEIMNDYENIFS